MYFKLRLKYFKRIVQQEVYR